MTAPSVTGNVGLTGNSRSALSPASDALMHPPFPVAVQPENTTGLAGTPSEAAAPSVAVEPWARVRERAPPSPDASQEEKSTAVSSRELDEPRLA